MVANATAVTASMCPGINQKTALSSPSCSGPAKLRLSLYQRALGPKLKTMPCAKPSDFGEAKLKTVALFFFFSHADWISTQIRYWSYCVSYLLWCVSCSAKCSIFGTNPNAQGYKQSERCLSLTFSNLFESWKFGYFWSSDNILDEILHLNMLWCFHL